jgi:hypothetical protein
MSNGWGKPRAALKAFLTDPETRFAERENDGTTLLLTRFSLDPMSIPMLAVYPASAANIGHRPIPDPDGQTTSSYAIRAVRGG